MSKELCRAWALFDPSGRLSAPAYRGLLMRMIVLGFGLLCLGIWLAALSLRWSGILVAAGTLPVILATSIQTVRRLHDRNRSGWWLGAYILAEATSLLPLEGVVDSYPIPVIGLVLAMLGFFVWFFLETVFRSGSPEANRYGAVPLDCKRLTLHASL